MNEKELQDEISNRVKGKIFPILERYLFNTSGLDAILKWKPIVLIIGNYSSGKSTLVNEMLGNDIQRTGQAPTDDSFTIITAPDKDDDDEGDTPGSTLVNDERLPFTSFKAYGERLSSHLHMKKIKVPFLENLTIIDSPGMLDSVTEKGRGYDFPRVIGDFAKLADLVVLMFDPHKAGTIKETYTTIRNTLPEAAGEDRVVFVMSRIDECDNLHDLVRSYGTLCWNLSQMTGRKDIPRIFLTFSPVVARDTSDLDSWVDERDQLKQKILEAPELRINNILHEIDKKVNELKMVTEAMVTFYKGGKRLQKRTFKEALISGILVFIALYFSGMVIANPFILPSLGVAIIFLLTGVWFLSWRLPRFIKKCKANVDQLITLDTVYKEQIWSKVKKNVLTLLSKPGFEEVRYSHQRNLDKIDKFIKNDLQNYFTLKP